MTHTADTFWSKVHTGNDDDCWEWMGYLSRGRNSGQCVYGRIDIFGHKGVYVHRVAYFLAHPGEISLARRPEGLFVLHKCDNPPCCNPAHLFLGTHQENMRDMVSKGRAPTYTSVGSPRAKLTAEEVFWIRVQQKYGATLRALALLYDVSHSTISGLLYGRHYQDVT